MSTGSEHVELDFGKKGLEGLVMLASVTVSITALSVGFGFFFFLGYATTIGAAWIRELLPPTTLVMYGAPVMMALFSISLVAAMRSRSHQLPDTMPWTVAWALFMVAGVLALVFTRWTFVFFSMQVMSGAAASTILPVTLVGMLRKWRSRQVGLVQVLAFAIGIATILPLVMGISRGLAERAQPSSLAAVALSSEAVGDWRLVLAIDERLLLTKLDGSSAFREFKLVEADAVSIIKTSRAGAPWAPASD